MKTFPAKNNTFIHLRKDMIKTLGIFLTAQGIALFLKHLPIGVGTVLVAGPTGRNDLTLKIARNSRQTQNSIYCLCS